MDTTDRGAVVGTFAAVPGKVAGTVMLVLSMRPAGGPRVAPHFAVSASSLR
jgi:hypothetical protein